MAEPNEVWVETAEARLGGTLTIPDGSGGIVIFVHGSGSSRFSPRNRYVADDMNKGGLATLLFDLLTEEEEQVDLRTRQLRFDINLLARRTVGAIDWLAKHPQASRMAVGTFGSSTGAAAALIAAAERPAQVKAVVSRGGRPDLAAPALPSVQAPTLMIVGELDVPVLQMNQDALAQMKEDVTAEIKIIQGATHLFEEPGALERVSEMARDWFRRFLLGSDEIHFR